MSNMVVRTNVFALNAHRNMKNVGLEQGRASNRLASGYRINSAADDAAGLAISETMRAQIRGLDQASRNSQDGQALILTAEGGLNEIQNMMQRIRELAVQGANDTNVSLNRQQIALEVSQLNREIEAMSERVEFNTIQLLHSAEDAALNSNSIFGSESLGGGLFFQIGANSTQSMVVRLDLDALQQRVAYNVSVAGGANLGPNTPPAGVTGTIPNGPMRALLHAMTGTLNHVAAALEGRSGTNGITGSGFNYSGAPVAGLPPQSGGTPAGQIPGSGLTGDQVSSQPEWISFMIGQADGMISIVSDIRAELGAISNRLDYTMRSLDISSENLSDAESRVRNADMAREMMRFTMSNVLQQASVSMLAQANQLPNNLLQLLR